MAALIILICVPAMATTLVLASDERMVDRSDLVVVGTVTGTRAVETSRGIWTLTDIVVEQTLKGTPEETITVTEPGGSVDQRLTVVFGAPRYEAGERVLAFLVRDGKGAWRTTDMIAGKFTESVAEDGRRLWDRELEVLGVRVLENGMSVEANAPEPRGRVASELEEFIRARAGGRPAAEAARAEVSSPVRADFAL
ncbi:MAG: hypothetical protein ABR517_12410, partial [Thermoanaerobaculia bacterium]